MDQRRLKLYDPEFRSSQSRSRFSASASDACRDTSDASSGSPSAAASSVGATAVMMTRVVGEARVALSVADLLPLLADAYASKRAWLNDFADDRVIVSQDLYEVVLAYKRLRNDKAA